MTSPSSLGRTGSLREKMGKSRFPCVESEESRFGTFVSGFQGGARPIAPS